MREEEGMSKRCECQCLLEGWEGDGGRGLKLLSLGRSLNMTDTIYPTCAPPGWWPGAPEWVFWVSGDACGPPCESLLWLLL